MKVQAFWVVLLTALVYGVLARLNGLVFDWANFSHGVDWIFLPSGLRLTAVLSFGALGSLGIALASLEMSLSTLPGASLTVACVTAVISGFSPLVAAKLGSQYLRLQNDLNGLTANALIRLAALFAIVSGSTHQLWYWYTGLTTKPIRAGLVMIIGDFLGSVILLFLVSWGTKAYSHMRQVR